MADLWLIHMTGFTTEILRLQYFLSFPTLAREGRVGTDTKTQQIDAMAVYGDGFNHIQHDVIVIRLL